MIRVVTEGQDLAKMKEILEKVPEVLASVLKDTTNTMRNLAEGKTPRLTGHLKRNWSPVQAVEKGLSFENPVDYAVILEEGLYPRVGPGTVQTDRGIFSRKAREGMLYPLIQDDTVIDRVVEMIVTQLNGVISRES